MTPNNNLNPLAFYKSQNDMFRARPYNYGIKYPLYMPLNRVTPFQIIRGLSESTTLTSAKIYNDRGVEVATVTSYMSVNVVTIGASKVMQFKCGNYANLTPGQYTMRVVIGNDTYYSEVFTAYANIGKLVKVEYYNADPIIFDEGALTYDNGFKFELYLCTEIAKPEYLFEEESTKRGGFTFVENQISSKQYKMVIAAPEYLCDAIRIIRLHDHVAITKDGNAYEAYNFTPSYQWNDVGDLAQVTITFESNTVLQKISAYKGSQSVFKNALLAAASVPIMFSPNVIAQYGASVDGVAEAYTEFTGKLIRQLEEQTTLPKEAWVAIDTGTGEAKKMSIGLLGGGTGKPSELWTNDKKIKYLYIKEDNSEAYITKQFIGDSNIMAKGDIVAYQSGNWDLVTPTAGYDTLGMARFNSSDFTIDNGLVGLKVGAVGQRYYAGKGLSLASINGGTDNQFNVVFGELENTVMQGNDARFLKLYNGTWWGQAFDKSTGIVKGAMTSVDSINTLVYFNTDKSILVTKNKSAEGIKFSGGNSINGVYGSATNNLYLNYTDATHNVKIDANHNIFANGDIVAYASGNYDISKPLAGYDAVGMSRYDKTQFEVVNGLVRIIDGGGGGTIAGVTPGTAGDFVYELASNGSNIVYNRKTFASVLDGRYVKKAGDTMAGLLTVPSLAVSGSTATVAGNKIWHAGNDGSGSGLDADLLDGKHLSDILASNVASATKLQTTRTIWGQNFNGTQNVSGNMTGVGIIHSYKGITLNPKDINGTIGQDNAYWYGLGLTADHGKYVTLGGYYGLKMFTSGVQITMTEGGNVGIGTNNPTRKLHLAGRQVLLGLSATGGANVEYNYIHGDHAKNGTFFRLAEGVDKTLWLQYSKPGESNLYGIVISGMNTQTLGSFKVKASTSIFEGNVRATGDVVAYASGNYDISKPLAGYDAVGMSRYDKTQFEVVNGLVRIIDGGGGGTIAGVTPGTAGDFVYELASNGSNIVYNRKTFASVLDGRYVKKAGDTMAGLLTVPSLAVSGSTATVAGNKIWHAGNDGSGSGLDADLLDGKHLSDILASNVASATKLQTTRTIWGQNFNGTQNVSGNMTGVGIIHSYKGITLNPKDINGTIGQDNAYWYGLGLTADHGKYVTLGGYYGLKMFTSGVQITMTEDGNVGIGTSDPGEKLEVNGHIKCGHVYPKANNTYDLGISSVRWRKLFLSGINGSWIKGKTDAAITVDSTNSSTSTYFPLYRWKSYTGRVFNLGALQGADSGHQFGFYMFAKDQTANNTNASFYMYSNGNMNGSHSLIMQQDVVAYGSSSYNITSPTAGYDALGLARFDSTYFTVSSGYVTLKASATSPIRSVTATTLNPGSNANASWNSSTGALSLGIPRGNTGATGKQGASVTYQWSGTSLRMGVTPYGGSTTWGSYVNLKGATGSPGPSWNGGEVTNNITIKATWAALGLSGGTNNFYLSQRGDNIVYFCFGGTNNNKGSFSPSGNMYVSGSYSNGSDIRLKYRLEDISDILGKIKDISAFYYIRKDLNDGVIRIGVSAQDVIKQFPQVVSNNSINGKEYYSVEYATLGVAIAVNGLKEVHQLVQDNKNEIDLLKIEIASLKERLAKLEAA